MQPTSPLQNLSYWLLLLLCAAASIMEGSPTVSSLGHICTEQDTGLLDQPTAQTWPNGIIPYEISNHLSGDVRRKLLLTMQAQEITSCVIFTPHGSEPDFVSFETGERCCSNIGYIGQGRQDVLLGNPCTESGSENQLSSIIHMLVGMKDTGIATDGNPKKRQTSAKLESFSATINHNCDAICGGCAILDKSNNLIEHLLGTPQYPGHYQTHLDCTWKLAAPEGFSLRLNFHDLDLEEHDSCRHDYLSVQYLNDHGQVLRSSKLCGSPDMLTLNQPTSHDVNISIAVLHFHSDSSYGGKGLLVGYTVREKPVNKVDPCSMNNGGCAGVCTSDAFGDHVCSCKPGYRLTRRGRCLDINECKVNKGGCVHKCTNIEGSFSCHCRIGYELSADQRSCHTCNFTMNQRSGIIYPTGYPVSYKHNQNCLWFIYAWPEHHLKITISNFDTIDTNRCTADFLKLDPSKFPYQGRLCGYHSHIEYYVQGKMKLRFRSKIANSYHGGFRLSFEQMPTSQLNSSAIDYVNVDGKTVPYTERLWL